MWLLFSALVEVKLIMLLPAFSYNIVFCKQVSFVLCSDSLDNILAINCSSRIRDWDVCRDQGPVSPNGALPGTSVPCTNASYVWNRSFLDPAAGEAVLPSRGLEKFFEHSSSQVWLTSNLLLYNDCISWQQDPHSSALLTTSISRGVLSSH